MTQVFQGNLYYIVWFDDSYRYCNYSIIQVL